MTPWYLRDFAQPWIDGLSTGLARFQMALEQPLMGEMLRLPFVWVGVTLLAFAFGEWAQRSLNGRAICNPILVSAIAVCALLALTRTTYETYSKGGEVIIQFLAPLTVALAVPTSRHAAIARSCLWPLAIGVLSGGLVAVAVTVLVAQALGASMPTLASLAPHGTTMAISIELSRLLGGLVPITAIVTITTGMIGAMFGTHVLGMLGVRDPRAVGLALGVASHAIGTSRALTVSERMGAFAAIGLAANGVMTSILVVAWLLLPRVPPILR